MSLCDSLNINNNEEFYNFKAFASELLEHYEDILIQYYMHSAMFSKLISSTTQ